MRDQVTVYLRKYPFEVGSDKIIPTSREEEIQGCKSIRVRNEKFYAWKLLEYALFDKLAKSMEELNICKVGDKWVCEELCFSISHTQDVVAVAVSDVGVGVDVEREDNYRWECLTSAKLLSDEECNIFSNMPLIHIWTKKEAIFKLGNGEVFVPKRVFIESATTVTESMTIDGISVVISVATNNRSDVDIQIL